MTVLCQETFSRAELREISNALIYPQRARPSVSLPPRPALGRTLSETAGGVASRLDPALSRSARDARQTPSAAVPGVRGVSHPPHSRASILAAGDAVQVTHRPASSAASLLDRFELNAMPEPNSGCWLWLKGVTSHGYGTISVNNKAIPAHVLSWRLYRGEIPNGLLVCHHCDVRVCVNPDHLFLGTHTDNARDREKKGRGRATLGSNKPNAILNDADVLKIRGSDASLIELAAQYGVSLSTISRVKNRKRWRHVAGGTLSNPEGD